MPAPPEGEPADTMRQMEREIMLQLIDQRWREHLSEMDYLREGINLRSLGQKDPLTEWQKDGYEMFGQLMASIDDDYVKYVMHAQVQVQERPARSRAWPGPSTWLRRARCSEHKPSPAPWPPDRWRVRRWCSPPKRTWWPCAEATAPAKRAGPQGRRR